MISQPLERVDGGPVHPTVHQAGRVDGFPVHAFSYMMNNRDTNRRNKGLPP